MRHPQDTARARLPLAAAGSQSALYRRPCAYPWGITHAMYTFAWRSVRLDYQYAWNMAADLEIDAQQEDKHRRAVEDLGWRRVRMHACSLCSLFGACIYLHSSTSFTYRKQCYHRVSHPLSHLRRVILYEHERVCVCNRTRIKSRHDMANGKHCLVETHVYAHVAIYLYTSLYIYLYTCLCTCLYIGLYAWPCTYPYTCLTVFSIHMSMHVSRHMAIRMSIHMAMHMSIHTCLYKCLYTCLYKCPYACLYTRPYTYLYIW